MGRRALTSDQYPVIAKAYKQGATTLALAAQHGVSEGTIRTALKATGCESRPRAERARRAHAAAGRGIVSLLDSYRGSDWLDIGPEDWTRLRRTYADEQLAEELNKALTGYPVPYPTIDDQKAMGAFQDLRAAPFDSLFGPGPIALLRSPQAEQPDYHFGLKPPGNAASNQLFCRLRWSTPRAAQPSVAQRWTDVGLRLRVCRRFLKLSGTDRMSAAAFRRALCVTGATPSQFKPGVARALYELVGAQSVLDMSAGWGDRLVGFCAAGCTRGYTGIDPSPELHPLYQQLAERYAGDKDVTLICGPAEETDLPPASFDLAFTSPPYFQVEKYAEGTAAAAVQSWARYVTPEQWRQGFLAPMLRRAWAALKPGGVLALNLADVRVEGESAPLCRWLQEEVSTLEGSATLPTIGMRLQGSNYTPGARAALSGEPVWMWSKGPLARKLSIVASSTSVEEDAEDPG